MGDEEEFEHNPEKFIVVRIVSDDELDDAAFLSDAKEFNRKLRVPRGRIRDWLAQHMSETRTVLLNAKGIRCYPDLEAIEKPDLADDDVDGFEWWYKDWCKPVPAGVPTRLRSEARERVRVIITILRMIFPKEASVWGQRLAGYVAAKA